MWLDGIVFIYPSEADALAGAPYGATGFLMQVNPSEGLPPAAGHLYIVTNAHVIESGGEFVRFNIKAGGVSVQQIPHDGWFLHPDGDDLALAPVGPPDALQTANVPFEMAATPDLFETQILGPGDEAFFIGRFVNRDGKSSNIPTARFGSIAQVGGDPIYQSGRGFRQDSILVECHSLSGFSGSPVFAYRAANIRTGANLVASTHLRSAPDDSLWVHPQLAQVYLIGVDWGSDPWTADVRDKGTDKPVRNEYVRASSGMACVVPAWKLRGALDHPDLIEFRRVRENIWRSMSAEEEKAAMDSAIPPESPEPFDRDSLMANLDKATHVIPPAESAPEG
jgi:hypothetical protein